MRATGRAMFRMPEAGSVPPCAGVWKYPDKSSGLAKAPCITPSFNGKKWVVRNAQELSEFCQYSRN